MARYLVDIDLNYNQLKSAVVEKMYIDPTTGQYRSNRASGELKSPTIGQILFDLTDSKLKFCYQKVGSIYQWRPADSQSAVDGVTGDPTDTPDMLTLHGLYNGITELNERINNIGNPYATIEYTRGDFVMSFDPIKSCSSIDFTSNDITIGIAEMFVDNEAALVNKEMLNDRVIFIWNGNSISQDRIKLRISGRLKTS